MTVAMIVATVCCMMVAYLVCGIPFGLLIASMLGGVDVRTRGSGNIGMTNVARSVGGKAAALTLLCDAGKGTACMMVARWALSTFVALAPASSFGPSDVAMLALAWVYVACVLGHIFSPYLHFHGGKGISVGFGAGLGLWWPIGLGMLAVFLAVALPTRYVSAGSVCAAASLPVQCLLWKMEPMAVGATLVVAMVVIWSHRENLARLLRGQEHAFSIHHEDAADNG